MEIILKQSVGKMKKLVKKILTRRIRFDKICNVLKNVTKDRFTYMQILYIIKFYAFNKSFVQYIVNSIFEIVINIVAKKP